MSKAISWMAVSAIVLGSGWVQASEQVTTAQVFEKGSHQKKLLFHMRRVEKTQGNETHVTEVFTDPEGKEALHSETTLEGDRFKSYVLDQKQTGERAKIEARDGKLFFEYVTRSGKVEKDDEDWQDNFVLSTTMGHFVKAHWQEVLRGRDLELRFGVPDRQETVGFKLFREREVKMNGRDVVVTKMKPTSVFISAIVKPLYFYFDRASGSVVKIIGRTLPKIREGDDWKDLDAETVYDSASEAKSKPKPKPRSKSKARSNQRQTS